MNFLTVNGKPQTHNGKFITVPDGYNDELIKVDGKLLKTNDSGAIYQTNDPIGKKHRINRIYLFAFDQNNEKILGQYVFDNIDIDTSDGFIVSTEIFSNLFIETREFPEFPEPEIPAIILNLKAFLVDDKNGEIFTIRTVGNGVEDNVYIQYSSRDDNIAMNDNFCAIWSLDNYTIEKDFLINSSFTIFAQNSLLKYCTILFDNSLLVKGIETIYYISPGYFPSEFNLISGRPSDALNSIRRISFNKRGCKLSCFSSLSKDEEVANIIFIAVSAVGAALSAMRCQIPFTRNNIILTLSWPEGKI